MLMETKSKLVHGFDDALSYCTVLHPERLNQLSCP